MVTWQMKARRIFLRTRSTTTLAAKRKRKQQQKQIYHIRKCTVLTNAKKRIQHILLTPANKPETDSRRPIKITTTILMNSDKNSACKSNIQHILVYLFDQNILYFYCLFVFYADSVVKGSSRTEEATFSHHTWICVLVSTAVSL